MKTACLRQLSGLAMKCHRPDLEQPDVPLAVCEADKSKPLMKVRKVPHNRHLTLLLLADCIGDLDQTSVVRTSNDACPDDNSYENQYQLNLSLLLYPVLSGTKPKLS